MASDGDVVLRPMVLRPMGRGGSNPFSSFGKGAGFGVKKAQSLGETVEVRKPDSEIIKYSREVLMQYSLHYMKLPYELENLKLDIILDPDDPGREVQRQTVQRAVEDADDRDWRSRAAAAPAELNTQQSVAGNASSTGATDTQQWRNNDLAGPGQPNSQGGHMLPELKKAEKAWAPGTSSAEGNAKALKQIKGILNKLTPEKFERLLSQLLECISNTEVLQGTIRLVFENAVLQPTFVNLYAELCDRLSKELPQFPPAPGESKPMTFRRILLNTCQEEFEGVEEARKKLATVPPEDLEFEEKKVKSTLLGVVRLIAELYKKGVVVEKIMLFCLEDLVVKELKLKKLPPEDNIEAACEMVRIGGKRLDESAANKGRMEGYMAQLDKLAKDTSLPSRIRFLVRDIVDLRHSKWVPRREVNTAKKISEIHAEAHAELGMASAVNIASVAPDLPGLRPKAKEDDTELFPAFRTEDAGWEVVGKKKDRAAGGQYSALMGEYVALPRGRAPAEPAQQASAAPAAAPAAPAVAQPPQQAVRALNLSPEERESRGKGLWREYLSSHDAAEALLSARELVAPGFTAKLVELGVEALLDTTKEKDQVLLVDLLISLCKRNAYAPDDLVAGVQVFVEQVEDLSFDFPTAPKLLGGLLSTLLREGILDEAALTKLCDAVEDSDPKNIMTDIARKGLTGGK